MSGVAPGAAPADLAPLGARAAAHTATAEELAAEGRWEDAYRHLRAAVQLLDRVADPAAELDRLRREHAEAREQCRRDGLTALYNRRYLDERLTGYLDEPADPEVVAGGISLALVDVDHFKQVNDTHGHPLGDRVLQRLVTILDAGMPENGFCARYGGEEFALVMPGVDAADAVRHCEALRGRVAALAWHDLARGLRVTISIGVAHRVAESGGLDTLVGAADALLYAAKQAGRNAVAHRHAGDGRVALAGAAAGRRMLSQPTHQRVPPP